MFAKSSKVLETNRIKSNGILLYNNFYNFPSRALKVLLRYFLTIIFLLFLNNTVFAAETVNNFDDFNKVVTQEGANAEVSIESDLKASCDLGCQGKDDLKIYGNNHTLDGANQQGIIVEQNKNLTVENLEIENFKSSNGGALMSEENSSVDIKDVTFKNNEATEGDGGAFCKHCQVKDLTGEFSENSAYHNGGAVCNQTTGEIQDIQGTFENNTAKEGFGGAIFNFGSIGNINADFLNNTVEEYYGGAIANMKVIGSIRGNFLNNGAYLMGGAIYNEGMIGSIAGNFENNTSVLGGGAIMNYGEVRSLEGSFLNNSTQTRGGAIYNGVNGVINIKANNDDVIFRGNSDSTGSNAIYNEAVVNMNAMNHNIIFDDKIDGYRTQSSTININSDSQDSKVVFNNEVSNNTVNLRHGVLEFGKSEFDGAESFGNFSNSVNFNYYDGTISLQNGNIQNTNLGNLELFSDMDLKLEGDFENLKLDTFTLDSFKSNGHKINISNILLLSPTTLKSFSLSPIGSISDSELFNSLKNSIEYSGGDVVYSPIFKYITTYDPNTGMLNFAQPEYDNFNPAILLSPIAAQIGGYLHLSRSYQEAFRNMDMYALLEKKSKIKFKISFPLCF